MRWNNSSITVVVLTLAAAAQVSAQSAPAASTIHKQKYAMGTVFEVVAYDTQDRRATAAIEDAFQEIERLDDVLSNYKPESELSRLNRNGHFHAQTVSRDLYRVIEQSLEYSHLSEGEFDISVGPLVDLWKAQDRNGDPNGAEEEKARACVGFENIELIAPDRVVFHSPCLRIDVGAIGKGYAVDRAAEILRSEGISSVLINAGGSTVYAVGAPPGQEGWRVELRDPSGKLRPEVVLKDNSVSTSEQSAPSLLSKDVRGHIISPQSGKPLNRRGAVSVVARTATDSDALSTTMFLVGPARGKTLIAAIPETAAVWILPEGQVEGVENGARIFTSLRADEAKHSSYSEKSGIQ